MEMMISNRIRTDVQSIENWDWMILENQHTMITLAEISMEIEEYHRINVVNLGKIDSEEYRSRSTRRTREGERGESSVGHTWERSG